MYVQLWLTPRFEVCPGEHDWGSQHDWRDAAHDGFSCHPNVVPSGKSSLDACKSACLQDMDCKVQKRFWFWCRKTWVPCCQGYHPVVHSLFRSWKWSSGWWFGTWLLVFHSVRNVIIPTDKLILFRGVGIPLTSHVFWTQLDHISRPSTTWEFWKDL